jgi:hypothetical protein
MLSLGGHPGPISRLTGSCFLMPMAMCRSDSNPRSPNIRQISCRLPLRFDHRAAFTQRQRSGRYPYARSSNSAWSAVPATLHQSCRIETRQTRDRIRGASCDPSLAADVASGPENNPGPWLLESSILITSVKSDFLYLIFLTSHRRDFLPPIVPSETDQATATMIVTFPLIVTK